MEPANAAVVNCQANRPDAGNVIYLYYPTTSDSNFPDDVGGIGETTSPLAPFDVSDLDSGIGTTAELRSAITERVKTDYCEFDVRIVQSTNDNGTTNPTPTDPRWQVIGIGSDGNNGLFGIADDVDIGDNDLTDFARVWADSFGNQYGGSGQALGGANSTFERWTNAIAGTVSHEAGHNYGVAHNDSASQPTEDPQSNHLLATGSTGLTGDDRVEDRHFSDTSFEVLAANIGLFEQTVSNWDFINPNDGSADGFRITVLVLPSDGAPSKASMYTGGLSPWSDVDISDDGSETFKGTNYNRYTIDFISPKSWNNGPDGQVPAGEEFHVGVGLTTDYLVRDTSLSSGGSTLELNPRVVGYTTGGSFDPGSGDFHVTFTNPQPEEGPLVLSDFRIRYIPRTIDINEMVPGGKLQGIDGLPVEPWDVRETEQETFQVVDTTDVTVGNLAEDRAVNYIHELDPQCERGITGPPPIGDIDAPFAIEYCPEGHVLGLFPATRVYFEATLTDPEARYFDKDLQRFVEGPLKSRIFVQLPGVKPDLNDNGIDDAIDIDTGECEDVNRNGVCDNVEPKFKYSAKLICGVQKDPEGMRLAQGQYATAINILNPGDRKAILTKKLSLTFPPEEQGPGEVLPIGRDTLGPDEALEVDCLDVRRRLFPDGFQTSYIKGFVVLRSNESLDVTAVYTVKGVEREQDHHRRSGRHDGCKQEHGNDPCHGMGHRDRNGAKCPEDRPRDCEVVEPPVPVSIDVEVVPERRIAVQEPPVKQCPDLVVREIGRPSVRCPGGSGNCRTTVRVVVANIGDADAGPFEVQSVLDPSQSVAVTRQVSDGLQVGEERTLPVVTPPGGNCFDPDCTISVRVDSGQSVRECDEGNNESSETTPG
ncbi:hypothetical protein GCM10007160_38200 [Litchfieldella qijiaojingensis]|uniref:CARDB domain-containing protein n=1 Tax=Litchfieldella qijiaojingensis TaxID=980347 RepID=A0ABQ2Z9R0_9GAMM|nr:CARDB domain-containing protein [Halomonas qijiaojingensis]GGY07063.1 hypothetical protein GCM10007160_38200 [Halomonas qijiaojingensis]